MCPEGFPRLWHCPQKSGKNLTFHQGKELFPRASADTPRNRDKIVMVVLEHNLVQGTDHLTQWLGRQLHPSLGANRTPLLSQNFALFHVSGWRQYSLSS